MISIAASAPCLWPASAISASAGMATPSTVTFGAALGGAPTTFSASDGMRGSISALSVLAVSRASVNARGAFLMTRETARAMVLAEGGGRVVNIASCCVWAPAVVGLASYAASKGALLTFGQTAAFELAGHGITVNTVLPGGVVTPGCVAARGPATSGPATRRPPLGMCEPRDIAAAVLFFATQAARYVTNQTIAVDAGLSLT